MLCMYADRSMAGLQLPEVSTLLHCVSFISAEQLHVLECLCVSLGALPVRTSISAFEDRVIAGIAYLHLCLVPQHSNR